MAQPKPRAVLSGNSPKRPSIQEHWIEGMFPLNTNSYTLLHDSLNKTHLVLKIFAPLAALPAGASANVDMTYFSIDFKSDQTDEVERIKYLF